MTTVCVIFALILTIIAVLVAFRAGFEIGKIEGRLQGMEECEKILIGNIKNNGSESV